MRSTLSIAAVVVCAAALAPRSASAQEDIEQAKALFNAGAQAYAATRYQDAVQSFEAAYKKAPRPAILFSLAQAYRRLYVVDQKPESLKAAIADYRLYLAQVPQGGRRSDAAEALSELEVVAARVDIRAPTAAAPAPEALPEVKLRTRINVTSPTAGARVSLDGRPPVVVPLMEEVPPGKHKIKIMADGYIDEERDVMAVEGDVTGLDRELRERPALLVVKAPDGAQITLDGRFIGTTPLPPIEVAPGQRFFVATKNGAKAFSRDLTLRRGQRQTVDVQLPGTFQRTASYGAFVLGGLTVGAGVASLLVALGEQRKAQELSDKRSDPGLTEQELGDYQEHLDKRDQYAVLTGGLFGGGLAVGTIGFALYALDTPNPPPPPVRTEPTPRRDGGPTLELAATPVAGPGFAGAALAGRF